MTKLDLYKVLLALSDIHVLFTSKIYGFSLEIRREAVAHRRIKGSVILQNKCTQVFWSNGEFFDTIYENWNRRKINALTYIIF